jgi:hypothetical protein
MLLELAKPTALLGIMFSLLGVFHAAFLAPVTDVEERIYGSFGPLLLATGVALLGGLLFRSGKRHQGIAGTSLISTFPVQIFCWSVGIMFILFILSCYLETHCIFYRDIRF